MPEAIDLLIKLATGDPCLLEPGAFNNSGTVFDRARATHRAAFDQLCQHGYLKFSGGQMYELTLDGFNAADVYIALMNPPDKGPAT